MPSFHLDSVSFGRHSNTFQTPNNRSCGQPPSSGGPVQDDAKTTKKGLADRTTSSHYRLMAQGRKGHSRLPAVKPDPPTDGAPDVRKVLPSDLGINQTAASSQKPKPCAPRNRLLRKCSDNALSGFTRHQCKELRRGSIPRDLHHDYHSSQAKAPKPPALRPPKQQVATKAYDHLPSQFSVASDYDINVPKTVLKEKQLQQKDILPDCSPGYNKTVPKKPKNKTSVFDIKALCTNYVSHKPAFHNGVVRDASPQKLYEMQLRCKNLVQQSRHLQFAKNQVLIGQRVTQPDTLTGFWTFSNARLPTGVKNEFSDLSVKPANREKELGKPAACPKQLPESRINIGLVRPNKPNSNRTYAHQNELESEGEVIRSHLANIRKKLNKRHQLTEERRQREEMKEHSESLLISKALAFDSSRCVKSPLPQFEYPHRKVHNNLQINIGIPSAKVTLSGTGHLARKSIEITLPDCNLTEEYEQVCEDKMPASEEIELEKKHNNMGSENPNLESDDFDLESEESCPRSDDSWSESEGIFPESEDSKLEIENKFLTQDCLLLSESVGNTTASASKQKADEDNITEISNTDMGKGNLEKNASNLETEACNLNTEVPNRETKTSNLETERGNLNTEVPNRETAESNLETERGSLKTEERNQGIERVSSLETERGNLKTEERNRETEASYLETEVDSQKTEAANLKTEAANLKTEEVNLFFPELLLDTGYISEDVYSESEEVLELQLIQENTDDSFIRSCSSAAEICVSSTELRLSSDDLRLSPVVTPTSPRDRRNSRTVYVTEFLSVPVTTMTRSVEVLSIGGIAGSGADIPEIRMICATPLPPSSPEIE